MCSVERCEVQFRFHNANGDTFPERRGTERVSGHSPLSSIEAKKEALTPFQLVPFIGISCNILVTLIG